MRCPPSESRRTPRTRPTLRASPGGTGGVADARPRRSPPVSLRRQGLIAAPTAGLHFTPTLLERLAAGGVEIHPITLHVGPGTFRPLRASAVEAHRLASEVAEVPAATAAAVNRARAEGRRIIAVGTTSTRALEWAADAAGLVQARRGEAGVLISTAYPVSVAGA